MLEIDTSIYFNIYWCLELHDGDMMEHLPFIVVVPNICFNRFTIFRIFTIFRLFGWDTKLNHAPGER